MDNEWIASGNLSNCGYADTTDGTESGNQQNIIKNAQAAATEAVLGANWHKVHEKQAAGSAALVLLDTVSLQSGFQ